jgi:large subunit ribosomal protein L23
MEIKKEKQIIKKPLVSEKSMGEIDKLNKYSFIVNYNSNKIEIASEIEKNFGVKVLNVRTINYMSKIVKFGKRRVEGRQAKYKKAVVTLKKGDKISLFDIK